MSVITNQKREKLLSMFHKKVLKLFELKRFQKSCKLNKEISKFCLVPNLLGDYILIAMIHQNTVCKGKKCKTLDKELFNELSLFVPFFNRVNRAI
jgi:hypothetical protein